MNLYFPSNWHHLDKQNRTLMLSVAIFGVILILTGLIVGLVDNLPAVILVVLGLSALALSVTYLWRDAKLYLRMFLYSLFGFFLSVLLHNLLYAFAEINPDPVWLKIFINSVSAFFFILAVLIFPVTAFIGFIGFIVTFMKNRKNSKKIPL